MSSTESLGRAAAVGRRAVGVARAADVSFLAAGVAYYAFVSLLPAVLLALVVASVVGGAALTDAVLAATGELLTETGQAVVETALTAGPERGPVSLVGLALLAWGVLKVFRALDTAFSRLYGADTAETFLGGLADAAVVAASVGGGLGLMLGVGATLVALDLRALTRVVGVVALPAALTVAFLPLYLRFPDVPVSVREALPGAAVAAVGWTVLQAVFQLYASGVGGSAFGVVGGVVLLVTWLYVASLVVLLGAVVNVVAGGGDGAGLATGDAAGVDDGPEGVADPDRGLGASGAVGAAGAAGAADRDRQAQGRGRPSDGQMSGERDRRGAPDVEELAADVEELRADLDAFADDVEDRTVEKPELEAELKRYVRRRLRRGHARGWGPYLVLAYGVVLSLGAFYWLDGWPAVAAMFVSFTSTLGLYALFVLVGVGLNTLGLGERAVAFVRDRRR